MIKRLSIITCTVLLCCVAVTISGADSSEPRLSKAEAGLTLAEALDTALRNNPRLKAVSRGEEAHLALKRQAGLRSNPEVEDLAWERKSDGFDTAAVVLSVSQVIETGGKRAIRSRIADLEARLSSWDHLGLRLDVVAGINMDFVNLLAAQKKQELAEEMHRLVSRIRDVAALERLIGQRLSQKEGGS